ncbi:MAG: hypothetical protein ACYCZY_03605 [Lacisediminihabitans sp.]
MTDAPANSIPSDRLRKVRLPAELDERLAAAASASGQSKQEVVLAAIEAAVAANPRPRG